MKSHLFLALLLAAAPPALLAQSDAEPRPVADLQQSLDVKYRLFKTDNNFTFLMLDTSSGKVWQVQFTIDDAKGVRTMLPINPAALLRDGEKPRVGRFTLYPTTNIYTFILLDQDSGRAFQCQWTLGKDRMIIPILPFPEDDKKQ